MLFGLLWGISTVVEPTLPAPWRRTLDLLGSGDFDEAQDRLVQLLEGAPIPPELAFIGLQIVQVVLVPIPGQLVGLLGGYLFGFWLGLAITMAGLAAGTFMAIGLARLVGEGVVRRFVPDRHVKRFDELVSRGGLWNFFLIFLLPALPDDAACFLAGLTRLSILKLVGVAVVGRLPGMAVLTFVGVRTGEETQFPYVIFGIAIVLSVIVWLFSDELEAWVEQHLAR